MTKEAGMAVVCETEGCSENGIPKDTEDVTRVLGFTGYDVTCGQCGQLCAWPAGENIDPKEPTE